MSKLEQLPLKCQMNCPKVTRARMMAHRALRATAKPDPEIKITSQWIDQHREEADRVMDEQLTITFPQLTGDSSSKVVCSGATPIPGYQQSYSSSTHSCEAKGFLQPFSN